MNTVLTPQEDHEPDKQRSGEQSSVNGNRIAGHRSAQPNPVSHLEQPGSDKEAVDDSLEELYFGRPKRIHVREFACVFGCIFALIAAYKLYVSGPSYGSAVFVFAAFLIVLISQVFPRALLPLWEGWMKFAHVLGTVMTFLIVAIIWCFIAIPIGLLLKVIGKKVMDLSYGEAVESYWEDRPKKLHDFTLLKRQF